MSDDLRFMICSKTQNKLRRWVAIVVLLWFALATAPGASLYVDCNSTNPVAPFADWSTAASIIQDALDAANAGDLILVTNGIYNKGGRPVNGVINNRIAVVKPVTVQSVNGPAVTSIQGVYPSGPLYTNTYRCAYLAQGAALIGFTLTNGGTAPTQVNDYKGGGAWCEPGSVVLSNCVLTMNLGSASGGGSYGGMLQFCVLSGNSGGYGGGANGATLSNCLIISNSAGNSGAGVYGCVVDNCALLGNNLQAGHSGNSGGGAANSTLNNCSIAANGVYNFGVPAGTGGGTSRCTLNNCIVYYNTAGSAPNDDGTSTMNDCCTSPLPFYGTANITVLPRFIDLAHLNVQLQSNSPCINAGSNAYVTNTVDLAGNPRIAGGTVDIGAYEFQQPASRVSYAWLQQYGLPTDGSADGVDTDGDGMNNWQEWLCGTNPTNAASVLRMLAPIVGADQVTVSWQSVTNRTYLLERAADLASQPDFQPLATGIAGQPGTTSFLDTNATGAASSYYRVGVQQ